MLILSFKMFKSKHYTENNAAKAQKKESERPLKASKHVTVHDAFQDDRDFLLRITEHELITVINWCCDIFQEGLV